MMNEMSKVLCVVVMSLLGALAACAAIDHGTDDEKREGQALQESEAALAADVAMLERQKAAGEPVDAQLANKRAALEATRDRLGEIESNIATRAVGGAIDIVDAMVPVPLQPFKAQLAGLIGLIAFPRSRKHLARSVKRLVRLDLVGAGSGVLRSVGLMHSNKDPIKVMRGAAIAARAAKDEATAKKIDAAIAQIRAGAQVNVQLPPTAAPA